MVATATREGPRSHSTPAPAPCAPRRPGFSRDEEVELPERVARGDQHARDRPVWADLGLVHAIARAFRRRALEMADLIGEGSPGPIRAARELDAPTILRRHSSRRRSHAEMDTHRSPRKWHDVSAVTVGVALLVSLGLGGPIGPLHFGPFLLAVLVSALVGGTGPGLTAAGLSLATRCLLAASIDRSLGPLAIGLWLVSFSGVEVLYVYLIAARRRDEAALCRSERRFRLLTEALPQLVWAARPDGGATYFNRRWYEVTGLTPETSPGDVWSRIIHPEDHRCFFDAWNQAARSGTAYEVECRHRCADGTYRWFLVQGVPSTDAAGRVVEWFGTCTDIDGQKQAAAALAEATRAKDEFLAVLSHELRTPLTPVLMAVTALLDDRQSYPLLRPTLKMIRDNVRLEARLIDDLLDVSRIARRQMEYRLEVVDVHTLIERTVAICQDQIESKGHHLTIELAAVEHHVRGDPARLQQVLWNLITNAAKYTPEGGRIAIRTLSYGPGFLAVEVADNGIGIHPDRLPRLFNAFERGHGAAAFHAGGLGLGLTISRSIVEAHGGTLQGASDGRNRGATFRLELATATSPGESGELSARPPSPARRGLRVLLAEDDAATAATAANVLRRQGHVVTTATSLSRALAVVSEEFDVVVSDIELGDGSGLELMRRVRSGGDTPGIAVSGYATEDDVQQSQEAGFAIHLAKPITFEMLESAIHQVTAGRACCASSWVDDVLM
jgi:PAS domain S-box-containing protein